VPDSVGLARVGGMNLDEDDGTTYLVVVNPEEQYSIWPSGRELPAGWREEGTSGSRSDCLTHIAEVWKDMRPASARQDPTGATPTPEPPG
jgi:MbtH protein